MTESKGINKRDAEERLEEYVRIHRVTNRNFEWLKEETEGCPERKRKRDEKYMIIKHQHNQVTNKVRKRRDQYDKIKKRQDREKERLKREATELHREIYSESEEDSDDEFKRKYKKKKFKRKKKRKKLTRRELLFQKREDMVITSEDSTSEEEHEKKKKKQEVVAPKLDDRITSFPSLIK